jgi:hypothetical protein
MILNTENIKCSALIYIFIAQWPTMYKIIAKTKDENINKKNGVFIIYEWIKRFK